ncbi:hypothetical protein BT96DRAFT_927529 [Gymnopus androsaceus JB14]|uniref:Uncharacterized protein n=1 Tax=Gymnopus androsaceus JB14 TaxID=1447944 RepID=A0A6A4GQT5_9AGAR|nr:hypothetical protein BT96DRAFT_927529 [Gymnopus androsaceus JB14]
MSKLMMKPNKAVSVGVSKAEHEQRQILEEEGEVYSDTDVGVEVEGPDPEGYPRACG